MNKRIEKPISFQYKIVVQLKKIARKGCQLFSMYVETNEQQTGKKKLDGLQNISEFEDVFAQDILGLPPRRDIYFSIYLVPGATPISKAC